MIKILVADDHAVVREGLRQILSENLDAEIGEAGNAEEVFAQVRQKEWDVLVLDISMPDKSGLDVLKELVIEKPDLRVLVLSIFPEDQYAVRVLKAGAAGYMTKESAPAELIKAVKKVLSGGKYISPELAELLASHLRKNTQGLPHELLSDREYLILRMMASGKTQSAIADELSLSPKTISTYRSRILQKMNFKSNAEAIRYAIENHLLD